MMTTSAEGEKKKKKGRWIVYQTTQQAFPASDKLTEECRKGKKSALNHVECHNRKDKAFGEHLLQSKREQDPSKDEQSLTPPHQERIAV